QLEDNRRCFRPCLKTASSIGVPVLADFDVVVAQRQFAQLQFALGIGCSPFLSVDKHLAAGRVCDYCEGNRKGIRLGRGPLWLVRVRTACWVLTHSLRRATKNRERERQKDRFQPE